MNKEKDYKGIRLYRILLKLYPVSYLKVYKNSMEQIYKDMRSENKASTVWFRIVKELPGSLFHEHMQNIKEGAMGLTKRNYNLGLAVLILGYLTLISWALGIFLNIEIGIESLGYLNINFFAFFISASSIVFAASLILNIKELRITRQFSKGLKFTLTGIPPIAFCYLAVIVRGLTEGKLIF